MLHVGATNAGIGSALLRPIRALYNGPYSSVVSVVSGLRWYSTCLTPKQASEVHEVLREMGIEPTSIGLRILGNMKKRFINAHHRVGMVQLLDRVEAVGGMLVFDKNFFKTIPKAQRRAVIGSEVWHIMHLDDLKATVGVLGVGLVFGACCGLIAGSIGYYSDYDKFPSDERFKDATILAGGIGGGVSSVGCILGLVLQPTIHRSRVKAADTYAAKVLDCAQDAVDYCETQRKQNLKLWKKFPKCYRISYENGREISRRRIKREEVYDEHGNCKVDHDNPPITERIAYLRELAEA